MSSIDPQFLYLILILPSLFGVTLIGEGFYKVVHEDKVGFVSIFFGFSFLALVVAVYFLFSTYIIGK